MSPDLVVIPCGGKKRRLGPDEKVPARHLYLGPYFKAALRAAQAIAPSENRVRILSGRFGFVGLGDSLPYYEQRIDQPGHVTLRVLSMQADALPLGRSCLVLAGAVYADMATQVLVPFGWIVSAPLIGHGWGIGKQMAALNALAVQAKAAA